MPEALSLMDEIIFQRFSSFTNDMRDDSIVSEME